MSIVAHRMRARRTKCERKNSTIDGRLGSVRLRHDAAWRGHRWQRPATCALASQLRPNVLHGSPRIFSWRKKVRVFQANAPSPCNSPRHQSLLFFESKVS
jgi:hypothetical protein